MIVLIIFCSLTVYIINTFLHNDNYCTYLLIHNYYTSINNNNTTFKKKKKEGHGLLCPLFSFFNLHSLFCTTTT